jgi:hypothetical protein
MIATTNTIARPCVAQRCVAMKQNVRSNAARRAASRDGRRGRDARGTTTTRTTSPSSRARARATQRTRANARERASDEEDRAVAPSPRVDVRTARGRRWRRERGD